MISEIETALGKKAVIDRRPPQMGDVERTAADVTKAGRLFGYRPKTTFTEGIRAYARWLEENR